MTIEPTPDPSCGICLHVGSEHHDGGCYPTIEGGSACSCRRWIPLGLHTANELRLRAAELEAEARSIERNRIVTERHIERLTRSLRGAER